MKKLCSVFLAFLLLAMSFPLSAAAEISGVGSTSEATAGEFESLGNGAVDTSVSGEVYGAAPSSFTLVGTPHLPPVDNQGQVGCCVSQAATYMQFTNAVSRYLHSIDPSIAWNPSSGNYANIFSPKFTYNFAGSGTAWVYDVLKDQGCATMDQSSFYKTTKFGYSYYHNGSTLYTKSSSWDVSSGLMQNALNYRLLNYEQISMSKYDYKLTTTSDGRELVTKIKEALNQGNVVVTGGDAYSWRYKDITGTGALGHSGDSAIYMGVQGSSAGGHQVSVVGYDDNITCVVDGVTLTGAFLVANSWGSWENNGYIWVMYDAVNKTSEFSTSSSTLRNASRIGALDQFVFVYWDKDISIGLPDLFVTAEVEAADRESFDIELTRTDKSGDTQTYTPALFYYGSIGAHPNYYIYDTDSFYLNFNGEKNGSACTGYFSLGYNDLLELGSGKTINDYYWGLNVTIDADTTVTVKSLTIRNSEGNAIKTKTVNKTLTSGDKPKSAVFSCEDGNLVVLNQGEKYTISSYNNSSSLVQNGGSYKFTIQVADGYTKDYMTVKANDTVLTPNSDGVFEISNISSDTIVTVQGVIENKNSEPVSVSLYDNGTNGGWEYYNNRNVLVVNVDNAASADIYAEDGVVGTDSYEYTFRLTVTDKTTNETIVYTTVPESIYPFETSTLYRLLTYDAGLYAVKGREYSIKVDICYGEHSLYTGTINSTVCKYTTDPGAGHTHSFNGQTVVVSKPTCTTDGESRIYCSDADCTAYKVITVPATGHTEGDWTVTKEATSTQDGLRVKYCTVCGEVIKSEVIPKLGGTDNNTGEDKGDKPATPPTGDSNSLYLIWIFGLSAVTLAAFAIGTKKRFLNIKSK